MIIERIPSDCIAVCDALHRLWTQRNFEFISSLSKASASDLSERCDELEPRQAETLALFLAAIEGEVFEIFFRAPSGECRMRAAALAEHRPFMATISSLWRAEIDAPHDDALAVYNGARPYLRRAAFDRWLVGQSPLANVAKAPLAWLVERLQSDSPPLKKPEYRDLAIDLFKISGRYFDHHVWEQLPPHLAALVKRPGRPRKNKS